MNTKGSGKLPTRTVAKVNQRGLMRRFRQGATKGPGLLRPGAGYGRLSFGAPGPTQEVEPREELEPELFTGEEMPIAKTFVSDLNEGSKSRGDTIIDLTSE